MKKKREIRDYLNDILNECAYLLNKTQNLDYTNFIKNDDLKKAFVRSLEIIGEASKQIPPDVKKQYPEVEWKVITGMRDKLIHEYFSVDYKKVWETATKDMLQLKPLIEKIIKDKENE